MKYASRRRRYYSVTEAARGLGITRAAVHRAIKRGRLEATLGKIAQVTKGWRISPKSLNMYRVSLLHQWVGKKAIQRLTGYIPFRYHPL